MTHVDFDDYSDNYSALINKQVGFFCRNDSYFAEYKVRIAQDKARGEPRKILEYGCGIGRNLRYLHESFRAAELFGCDISERCLQRAQSEHPYARLFLIGRDAIQERFDLVFVANVFHHIAPSLRASVLETISSLLVVNGEAFIFEHNPYNPVTRHMVNTCPFDAGAVLVAPKQLCDLVKAHGLEIIAKQYALFFPVWLRKIQFLERHMGFLPLGGQYYIHACKR